MGTGKLDIHDHLKSFRLKEDGMEDRTSKLDSATIAGTNVSIYTNSFWTSKQRKGSSIHEISYRACFKPQLPRFFMSLLTEPGDIVLDPFSGRGTTVIEAGLMGRNFISNDINPLSSILSRPRFFPPRLDEIKDRMASIDLQNYPNDNDHDLSMFYHFRTLEEIVSLRGYLRERKEHRNEDHIDRWIRMVATNRLTGHSKGFFSVYTLPPNQAVSPERQMMINEKMDQTPEYRDVRKLVLKKSKSLLRNLSEEERSVLMRIGEKGRFLEEPADMMIDIDNGSIGLIVTSPPFLNIVQYSQDNWLRCWFNDIDAKQVERRMTMSSTVNSWAQEMGKVFKELYRITMDGGHVAFEVGEVRNRKVRLEETVIPQGSDAGFECEHVLINEQDFTKTSNIWGVSNNTRGTNTNRVAIFRK